VENATATHETIVHPETTEAMMTTETYMETTPQNKNIAVENATATHGTIVHPETTEAMMTTLAESITTANASTASIRLPPSITFISISAEVIYFSPGSSLSFQCQASGVPAPTIMWMKNSENISLTESQGQITLTESSSTLIIYSATTSDIGYYQCIVINDYGKSVSNVTFIQMAYQGMFASVTAVTYKPPVTGPFMIPCSNPPNSVPAPSYSWVITETGSVTVEASVTLSNDVQIDFEGNFYYANTLVLANSYNGAQIACSQYNWFLETTVIGSLSLIVLDEITVQPFEPTVAFPGYFTTINTTASSVSQVLPQVGQTVELHCFYYGLPTPTVVWYKVDRTALPNGRFIAYGAVLTIPNAQLSDSGEYVCEGFNEVGNMSQTLNLTIYEMPVYHSKHMRPHNKNVTQGENATFRCDPQSYPSIDYTLWYINGVSFTESVQYSNNEVIMSADYKQVTVINTCRDCLSPDLFVVSCNASNAFGYIFTEGYLNILLATVIVQPPTSTVLALYGTATLTCLGTSDPSTSVTIYWLFNGFPVMHTSNAAMYVVGVDYLTIDASMSQDGGLSLAGTYTCVAFNGYSKSTSQANLTISGEVNSTLLTSASTAQAMSTVSGQIISSFSPSYSESVTNSTAISLNISTTPLPNPITMPPSFVYVSLTATVIYFKAGLPVTMECRAKGSPTPEIIWMKDSVSLTMISTGQSSNIIFSESSAVMTINVASPADEGYYQCLAGNAYGQAVSNVTLFKMALQLVFVKMPPMIYNATEGGNMTIPCMGAPPSVPSATYVWGYTETSTELVLNDRIQMDAKGTLYYANVMATDQTTENLVCNQTNSFLETTREGSYSVLIVVLLSFPPPFTPPTPAFIEVSPSVVLFGETAVFKCFFYGYPTPTVTWTMQGTLLPLVRAVQSGNTLTIERVRYADAGTYTCTGSNSAGSATQQISVVVNAVPFFPLPLLSPHNKNVTEGHMTHFRCDAIGNPSPAITWYINGVSIDVTASTGSTSVSADAKVLTVRNVCKNCESTSTQTAMGVIACNASNSLGYVFVEGYLNVLDKTTIVQGPVSQVLIPYQTVTFTCQAATDPSTSLIYIWMFDDYVIQEDSASVYESTLTIDTAILPRGGVLLGGTYTCVAFNGYSIAYASAQLTVNDVASSYSTPAETTTSSAFNSSQSSTFSHETLPSSFRPSVSDLVSQVTLTSPFTNLPHYTGSTLMPSQVRMPPILTETLTLSVRYFQMGETVKMSCQATGTPAPQIQWMKDGSALMQTTELLLPGTVEFSSSNTVLLIRSAIWLNTGYYQCQAVNEWGTAVSNVTFLQMAAQGEFKKPFAVTQRYRVQATSLLIVNCVDAPKSVPSPTYSWVMTTSTGLSALSTPFPLTDRIQIDLQGNLYFANVQPSDSTGGRYLACDEYNPVLSSNRIGSYSTITVTAVGKKNYIKPSAAFIYSSTNTVLVGDTVELHCFFFGYPTPTITWTRSNGTALPVLHSEDKGVLTIYNVQQADGGEFVCRGSNAAGVAEQKILLSVGVAPYFEQLIFEPHNQNVTVGTTAIFYCDATSSESYDIMWSINGQPLNENSYSMYFELSQDHKQLTIEDVCKYCVDRVSDLSVVQCNVSNNLGVAFAQGYLNVLERTRIIERPQNETFTPGIQSTLSLTCAATSDPSTPVTIYWLHNNNIIHNDISPMYQISSTTLYGVTDQSTLMISLPATSQGQLEAVGIYTCIAYNGYSYDIATATVATATYYSITPTDYYNSNMSSTNSNLSSTPGYNMSTISTSTVTSSSSHILSPRTQEDNAAVSYSPAAEVTMEAETLMSHDIYQQQFTTLSSEVTSGNDSTGNDTDSTHLLSATPTTDRTSTSRTTDPSSALQADGNSGARIVSAIFVQILLSFIVHIM
jgi:hypothetical protein